MEKFTSLSSLVMPLCARDVDTDQIIPAQYLTSVSREGYGNNLFRRLRDSDPQFPLNLARYKLAQILVADSNFGCGSSREHAVWALQGAAMPRCDGLDERASCGVSPGVWSDRDTWNCHLSAPYSGGLPRARSSRAGLLCVG